MVSEGNSVYLQDQDTFPIRRLTELFSRQKAYDLGLCWFPLSAGFLSLISPTSALKLTSSPTHPDTEPPISTAYSLVCQSCQWSRWLVLMPLRTLSICQSWILHDWHTIEPISALLASSTAHSFRYKGCGSIQLHLKLPWQSVPQRISRFKIPVLHSIISPMSALWLRWAMASTPAVCDRSTGWDFSLQTCLISQRAIVYLPAN